MPNSSLDDSKPLRVRRGRVESVDLYEIKDNELDALENGTPAELQFNYSVFLLSIAFSAITTLVTATFTSAVVQTVYIVAAIVGVLLGGYFLVVWRNSRKSVKTLCQRIRERIPPEQERSTTDDIDAPTAIGLDDPDVLPPPKG
jgi:hypothetical protein